MRKKEKLSSSAAQRSFKKKKKKKISYSFQEVFGDKKGKLEVVRASECIFCDECTIAAEKMQMRDLVSVSTEPRVFSFRVETTGSLAADVVVTRAIQVISEKIEKLQMEDWEPRDRKY